MFIPKFLDRMDRLLNEVLKVLFHGGNSISGLRHDDSSKILQRSRVTRTSRVYPKLVDYAATA